MGTVERKEAHPWGSPLCTIRPLLSALSSYLLDEVCRLFLSIGTYSASYMTQRSHASKLVSLLSRIMEESSSARHRTPCEWSVAEAQAWLVSRGVPAPALAALNLLDGPALLALEKRDFVEAGLPIALAASICHMLARISHNAPTTFSSPAASPPIYSSRTARLPHPVSPTLGTLAPRRLGTWSLIFQADLTDELHQQLGDWTNRAPTSSRAYIELEWPVVETLMFDAMRQHSELECFWWLRRYKPTPQLHGGLQWTSLNYPPTRFLAAKTSSTTLEVSSHLLHSPVKDCSLRQLCQRILSQSFLTASILRMKSAGFEYHCDWKAHCGCPCALRIMRRFADTGHKHIFDILVKDVNVRHACCHTFAANATDMAGRLHATPSLHVALKSFIRRKVYDHTGEVALTWSQIHDAAVEMIETSRFLPCDLRHAGEDHDWTRDKGKLVCKHQLVVRARAGAMRYGRDKPLFQSLPPTEDFIAREGKGRKEVPAVRYASRWCCLAPLLLVGGAAEAGLRVFDERTNRQAEEYVRSMNRRFNGLPGTPPDSCPSTMWSMFKSDNLFMSLKNAMDHPGSKLDIWKWSFIGLCYVKKRKRKSNEDGPEPSFHFVSVYASIASCITYIVSVKKSEVVGWQTHMMDVVHELGSLISNLNIFNVGVADAKQCCHLVSCTLHHSRKGHVYDITGAAFHAAVRFVWANLAKIKDTCATTAGINIDDIFGLDRSFYNVGGIEDGRAPQKLSAAGTKGESIDFEVAFPSVNFPSSPFACCAGYSSACTDGDFTMWRRWSAHADLAMGLANPRAITFCDRHKGESIKADGQKLWALARCRRDNCGAESYDKEHPLGSLLGSPRCTFMGTFGPLLHVVRTHDDTAVRDLFWNMILSKACAMGMKCEECPTRDKDCCLVTVLRRKHDPDNTATGIYGQCNHRRHPGIDKVMYDYSYPTPVSDWSTTTPLDSRDKNPIVVCFGPHSQPTSHSFAVGLL